MSEMYADNLVLTSKTIEGLIEREVLEMEGGI